MKDDERRAHALTTTSSNHVTLSSSLRREVAVEMPQPTFSGPNLTSSGANLLRSQPPPQPTSSAANLLLRIRPPPGPTSSDPTSSDRTSSGPDLLRIRPPPKPTSSDPTSADPTSSGPEPTSSGADLLRSNLSSSLRREVAVEMPQIRLGPIDLIPPARSCRRNAADSAGSDRV